MRGRGRENVHFQGEDLERLHVFKYIWPIVDETGCMAHHIDQTESARRSFEKLVEMQRSIVRQEDASETEGKGIQNYGQTSYVVWSRGVGDNERTGNTAARNE